MNKLTGPVEVFESDFPSIPGDGKQPPKRLRRMSKRKLKRWLARQLVQTKRPPGQHPAS